MITCWLFRTYKVNSDTDNMISSFYSVKTVLTFPSTSVPVYWSSPVFLPFTYWSVMSFKSLSVNCSKAFHQKYLNPHRAKLHECICTASPVFQMHPVCPGSFYIRYKPLKMSPLKERTLLCIEPSSRKLFSNWLFKVSHQYLLLGERALNSILR